ncbi:MAG: serine protease [Magnetococcus sp. MYC-9]
MPDCDNTLVEQATLSVLKTADGLSCGTAFLVGPRHVLTCAHVVLTALGNFNEKIACPSMPNSELKLRFTRSNNLVPVYATVIEWGGWFPPGGDDPYDVRDLALLLIRDDSLQSIPADTRPVRFWDPPGIILERMLREVSKREMELRTTGHPFGAAHEPTTVRFSFEDYIAGNDIRLKNIQSGRTWGAGEFKGISGAPLAIVKEGKELGKREDLVVGMVNRAENEENHVAAKPVWSILKFLKNAGLREVTTCADLGAVASGPLIRVVCHGAELPPGQTIPPERLIEIDRQRERKAIVDAVDSAQRTSEPPTLPMMLILGDMDNRTDAWLHYLVEEESLAGEGLDAIQVEDCIVIDVTRPRGAGRPVTDRVLQDIFNSGLEKLAELLGLEKNSHRDKSFQTRIRHIFNSEDVSWNNKPPPPYIIYRLSSTPVETFDPTLLNRLIKFWDELVKDGLKRMPIIFFSFLINGMDSDRESRDLLEKIREKIVSSQEVNRLDTALSSTTNELATHIPPILGFHCQDIQNWIQYAMDAGNGSWRLERESAKRIKQTVLDIHVMRLRTEYISHKTLHSELDRLQLCRDEYREREQ